MDDSTDSLLSPTEISERLIWLEQKGWPQAEVHQLASDLASFCRGSEAEEALSRLVENIAAELLPDLVRDEIMGGVSPPFDYCGGAFTLLATKLSRQGFTVNSKSIALSDGTDLAGLMRKPEGEESGDWRCRLALLGALLRRMKDHPLQPPSY